MAADRSSGKLDANDKDVRRIKYDKDEAKGLIKEKLASYKGVGDPFYIGHMMKLHQFDPESHFHKSAAFKEESEHRLLATTNDSLEREIFYEATRYGLAPHCKVKVDKEKGGIAELILGPRNPMRESHSFLRDMMKQYKCEPPPAIINSAATYR